MRRHLPRSRSPRLDSRFDRRGAMLVFVALLLVFIVIMAAMAIDIGAVMLTRTNVQSAADSAALAGASQLGKSDQVIRAEAIEFANEHTGLDGNAVGLQSSDIDIGFWNRTLRTFRVEEGGNAVRVTTRSNGQEFFLAKVFGPQSYDSEATAIAAAVPRDIVFVVDLSGSMDDDTDSVWATRAINQQFGSIGDQLLNELMNDLFGTTTRSTSDLKAFLEGQGFEVAGPEFAYAVLTMDEGYLSLHPNASYRVSPGMSESARKDRAYAWLRDEFIPPAFGGGNPRVPFSNTQFWNAYIDYVLFPISHNFPPPQPPPSMPPEPQPPTKSYSHCYVPTHPPVPPHHTNPSHSGPGHSGPSHSGPSHSGPSHSGPSHSGPSHSGPSHSSPSHSSPGGGPIGMNRPTGVPTRLVSAVVTSVLVLETGFNDPACVAAEDARYAAALAQYNQAHLHWQTVLIPQWQAALQQYYNVYLPAYLEEAASKGSPPYNRGTLPPGQPRNIYNLVDRMGDFGLSSFKFNNPNLDLRSSANAEDIKLFANRFGFSTLTNHLVDHGSNLKPNDQGSLTPLAIGSPSFVGLHSEMVGDAEVGFKSFRMPPRSYPMHAVRRSLIRAIQVVEKRNQFVDMEVRDFVGVVTFDRYEPTAGAVPRLVQGLTGNYDAAMQACTTLEAVGDKFATTATEPGMIAGRNHMNAAARSFSDKVIVLFTDGVPNAIQSAPGTIQSQVNAIKASDSRAAPLFYNSDIRFSGDRHWRNAVLVQTHQMRQLGWDIFAVGIGAGADTDFMNRIAILGGTEEIGSDLQAGGDPRNYEQILTEIFKRIVHTPRIVLVK